METVVVTVDTHKSFDNRIPQYMRGSAIRNFMEKWLNRNCTGIFEILELVHTGELSVLFQEPDDAMKFKLTWG
jgi:hypothetical protein